MRYIQTIKLWLALFVLSAILSAVTTYSRQAFDFNGAEEQSWQKSAIYSKGDNYMQELDNIMSKVKEHRLFVKFFSPEGSTSLEAEKIVQDSPRGGVLLPGGEKLLGIVTEGSAIYALLVTSVAEKQQGEQELVKAIPGFMLSSGYKVTKINMSSIEITAPSGEVVVIELY